MDTAVVVAGGKATRLLPLTQTVPKALVEVAGHPLLYWIVQWLKSYGVKHLVLAVAYKKEAIQEFMDGNANFGMQVEYSEDQQGGTGQAFRLAIERYVKDDDFIAMNGDELTNMDLAEMEKAHLARKPIVTMALTPFTPRFGVARIEGDDLVGFEYGKSLSNAPVSIGVYMFNRSILEYLPETGSIEDTTFPKLAPERKILAYMLKDNEEWVSVNTQKEISEAESALKSWGNGDRWRIKQL